MLSLPIDKVAARALLKQKRRTLTDSYLTESNSKICEHLLREILAHVADTVLTFSPIGNEPDLDPLARELMARDIAVAFPVSCTNDTHLEFFTVSDLSELRDGAYGIKEPSQNAPRAVCTRRTVCIVPALSFDKRGMRIGYGKGYYDRFLSEFEGLSIGVVFSEMLSDTVPHDEHDIPVDMIITEGGVILPHEIT